MSFDKIKAMRNAERFLSQGKIRAAISEYQRVVENDPKDFSTLNILGDLYAKNSDRQEAVGCFTQVAEHYNTQGFSQKAIAIYNKIWRIEPNSLDVSAKLAQLYQSKGSVAEARTHYNTLAEHYQNKGQKIEALAIWKQIAELDPNNTDIYLKIAESCRQEEQLDEAARAFTEAGLRFIRKESFESATASFSKALEIKKDDLRALKGLVKAQIGLGDTDEAAALLEKVLKEQPFNRDILYLLVDCYLDMNNAREAERAVIKLVEQEPANYPKFLDVVKIYLKSGDLDGATRILSIAAEHLLVGGQGEEFLEWTNEVLARNPEQLGALQLVVRYHSWQRNADALKESLERLAEAAHSGQAIEEERYALSQLVLLAPQESGFAQRLQEINHAYGFETVLPPPLENGFGEISQYQNLNGFEKQESSGQNENLAEFDFSEVKSSFNYESNGSHQNGNSDADKDFEFQNSELPAQTNGNGFNPENSVSFEQTAEQFEAVDEEKSADQLNTADAIKLQKELESIEFYISQGYDGLAVKSLDELEEYFGQRTEIDEFRRLLRESAPVPDSEFAAQEPAEKEMIVGAESIVDSEPICAESIVGYNAGDAKTNGTAKKFESLDELKNEFDSEENEETDKNEDYETHYHLATAYREMGLMENAIREFQDAINLIEMNDGTRRFFQCANLLGHCFMEKEMPNLAVMWFQRGLLVADLKDEEKHALYYELGNAFDAGGETKNAVGYFGKLYAENIDYRDVGERLHYLRENDSNS